MARRQPDPRMRSQLVAPLLAMVKAEGGDADALIDRFGLPADARSLPEVVLPLSTLHALLDAAAAMIRDPFLGLHLAARFPRGAYGVLEYTCRSAPTIRAALQRMVRYYTLLNEVVTVTFEARASGAGAIEQRIVGHRACASRHGNEFFVAIVLLGARSLSGRPCIPTRAWFAHPAPVDRGELVALLGTDDIRWDVGRNGVELTGEVLDAPLVTADPPLLSLLEQQAAQALAARPASRLGALVKGQLRETLGETPPTLDGIAERLHMSARTLQRQLAAEGLRFGDLLDELRHELALDYVRDERRPLGEIAYLLGYSELSPFLRAFKRWTGKTPGHLRGA